ncbi:hypothetical protein GCM10010149_81210 [Nonomuraea roseoviolacea subsp. roseoviolacea]
MGLTVMGLTVMGRTVMGRIQRRSADRPGTFQVGLVGVDHLTDGDGDRVCATSDHRRHLP